MIHTVLPSVMPYSSFDQVAEDRIGQMAVAPDGSVSAVFKGIKVRVDFLE